MYELSARSEYSGVKCGQHTTKLTQVRGRLIAVYTDPLERIQGRVDSSRVRIARKAFLSPELPG